MKKEHIFLIREIQRAAEQIAKLAGADLFEIRLTQSHWL